MTVDALVYAAVSGAISYGVQQFNRPKYKNADPPDLQGQQRPGNRGTGVPVVVGRRTVLPVDGWLGDQRAIPQTDTVRTKGSSKKEVVTGYEFAEKVLQWLVVGPAQGLHAITRRGDEYWAGDLNPSNHPSGQAVTLDDGSVFRVYWGGYSVADNPITGFSDVLSVSSRFPGVMRIEWDRLNKGSSEFLPQLEYEVTGQLCESSVLGSDSILTDGINPAYAIWQVATARNGLGGGWLPDWLDRTALEEYAAACAAEDLGVNLILDGSIGQAFEAIALDTGAMLSDHRRLGIHAMRSPAETPATLLLDRVIRKPRPARFSTINDPTRTTYSYPDKDRRHESSTISVRDSYRGRRDGAFVDDQDQLTTPTSRQVALKMGTIRQAAQGGSGRTIRVEVHRDGENIKINDVLTPDGGEIGPCRVTELEFDLLTGRTEVTLLEGLMTSLIVPGEVAEDGTAIAARDPEPDPLVMVIDTSAFSGGSPSLAVARSRAHEQVDSAALYVSADGGGYSRVRRTLDNSAGGEITGSIPIFPSRFVPTQSYSFGDRVVPSSGYSGSWQGLEFECIATGTNNTEPSWPASIGGETPGGGPPNTARWRAVVSNTTFEFAPITSDYRDLPDLSADTVPWLNAETVAVASNGVAMSVRELAAIDETVWAASTVYTPGDYIKPLSYSTGLRYRCKTGGTSAALEPDELPTVAGQEFDDNGVVWVAEYFRQTASGLLWLEDGLNMATYPSVGDHVLIGRNALSEYIEDTRIASGFNTCVKTEPAGNGKTVELSTVTEVCVTLS